MAVLRQPGEKIITVGLVSNQQLFRDALMLLLSQRDDFKVLTDLKKSMTTADVIVLDSMAIRGDANLLGDGSSRRSPPPPCLAVIHASDSTPLAAFIEAGISGILDWNSSADYLCEAVRRVQAGETVISISSGAQTRSMTATTGLTQRESQVVLEVAAGKSNAEIATSLGVTVNTVKGHLVNIFEKLDLNNRVQLAAYVLEKGLPAVRNGASSPWDINAA